MSFFQHATPYPQTEFNPGTIMNIGALKKRVDKSSLPSQHIATSRGGIKNVSYRISFLPDHVMPAGHISASPISNLTLIFRSQKIPNSHMLWFKQNGLVVVLVSNY